MNFLKTLGSWLRRLGRPDAEHSPELDSEGRPPSAAPEEPLRPPAIAYRTSETTPANSEIADGELVEVIYNGLPLWIMFKCPCGRGHVISLPAAKDRRPHWSTSLRKGRVSLSPSVYQREGCFSHFWITGGDIFWARNSGKPPWIAAPRHYKPPNEGRSK
jgi:hypothetical protein